MKRIMKMLSQSKVQTQRIAKELAKELSKTKLQVGGALVILLHGDLGAGKTTFTQGFLRGLGVRSKITSPTFNIVKKYEIRSMKSETNLKNKIKSYKTAYHWDCYRINKNKEILELGWKEIISNPENIILVEWPERIKKILPKGAISVNFKYGERESERSLQIK